MIDNWQKFRRLPGPDRRLLIQALLLLPVVRVALRVFGFKTVHRLLSGERSGGANQREHTAPTAERLARSAASMVDLAASRGPIEANCLPSSLVLQYLVSRRGLVCELRIGTRKQGDRLEAHAWVEMDGLVLNDGPEVHDRFQAFGGDTLHQGSKCQ